MRVQQEDKVILFDGEVRGTIINGGVGKDRGQGEDVSKVK